MLGLASVSQLWSFLRGAEPDAFYVAAYLMVLAVWPYPNDMGRLVLAVLPLWTAYAVKEIALLAARLSKPSWPKALEAPTVSVLVFVMLPCAALLGPDCPHQHRRGKSLGANSAAVQRRELEPLKSEYWIWRADLKRHSRVAESSALRRLRAFDVAGKPDAQPRPGRQGPYTTRGPVGRVARGIGALSLCSDDSGTGLTQHPLPRVLAGSQAA